LDGLKVFLGQKLASNQRGWNG